MKTELQNINQHIRTPSTCMVSNFSEAETFIPTLTATTNAATAAREHSKANTDDDRDNQLKDVRCKGVH